MITSKNRHHIGFDIRMVRYTGIGRYIRGLLNGLLAEKDHDIVLFESREDAVHLNARSIELNASVYGISEQLLFPFQSKFCDCLHVPHYNAPLAWPKKLIVTIHDLIHLHYPNHLSSIAAKLYAYSMLPLITKKADAIIAVSEYTKKDLIETLKVPAHKIHTIHHGIDSDFISSERDQSEPTVSTSYFLFVGLLKAHKNIGILLNAFQYLKKKIKDIDFRLQLVGTPDLKQPIVCSWLKIINENPAISLVSNVSEIELKKMYRHALAFVFPSLLEGFGFPLLEAMASGVPVIASKTSSIPEVIGDAGLYFDPNSEFELITAMEKILTGQSLRQTLIKKGADRVRQFTWSNCVEKTKKVYESVLS